MTKKFSKIKVSIIILALILISFLISKHVITNQQEDYILYTVTRDKFIKAVDAKGTIEAIQSRLIKAPSILHGDTRIIEMVDEGAYVQKGDFLIQFDASQFQERLQSAKNNYENACADYESKQANIKKEMASLESQLKIEKYNLEQMKLRAKNSIYEAENKQKEIEYSLKKSKISYNQLLDKIESTKEINQKELQKARLKRKQAKLELERVQDDIDKLRITSPGEGLVVYKTIWGGSGREKVKVGSTPWRGMPLLEIPDQNKRKVQLTVNESDISQIKLGQKVDIRVEAIRDTVYTGKITQIASLASTDRATGNKVFDIEVEMDKYDERLKPGMSTRCQIIIEQIDSSLSIPLDAVVQKEGVTGVYTKAGNFRPIKTGISNSDFTIVQSGLKVNDVIQIKNQTLSEDKNKNQQQVESHSRDRSRRRFRP
ncbi:MAG: efflux RND transporter periplasmic adaptor subunit [Candidatus Marinimicrobia bacterium]|nr:efflux RND transporter periplasmic adaptor subunit [Candidatus Neomarinimicrobiota bacterium]